MRAGWKQFRGLFVSEFAEWMDRTLAEVETAPPIDTFAQAFEKREIEAVLSDLVRRVRRPRSPSDNLSVMS